MKGPEFALSAKAKIIRLSVLMNSMSKQNAIL